jgi:hypothetical protein
MGNKLNVSAPTEHPIAPIYDIVPMPTDGLSMMLNQPETQLTFAISWQVSAGFVPVYFTVGTRHPLPFYFSHKTAEVLRKHGVIENNMVTVHMRDGATKFQCDVNNYNNNYIGLQFLQAAGLSMDRNGWKFNNIADCF